MEKKLYLVETVSIFRQRYVVEAREAEHAADEVVMNVSNGSFKEFSQKHVDELITSTREITADEYVKLFDEDNDYLSKWNISQKMQSINTIDYGENNEEDSNNW
jgi:deoxyribose-phosphate aldolase